MEGERREGKGEGVSDVTHCTIIRVGGVNNNSGREEASRQVAVNRMYKEVRQRMIQGEEERMDEGGRALMCLALFFLPFFLHEWHQSGRKICDV